MRDHRLYPVPFHLIGDKDQFKKWQWITARVEKSKIGPLRRDDPRPVNPLLEFQSVTADLRPLGPEYGNNVFARALKTRDRTGYFLGAFTS